MLPFDLIFQTPVWSVVPSLSVFNFRPWFVHKLLLSCYVAYHVVKFILECLFQAVFMYKLSYVILLFLDIGDLYIKYYLKFFKIVCYLCILVVLLTWVIFNSVDIIYLCFCHFMRLAPVSKFACPCAKQLHLPDIPLFVGIGIQIKTASRGKH